MTGTQSFTSLVGQKSSERGQQLIGGLFCGPRNYLFAFIQMTSNASKANSIEGQVQSGGGPVVFGDVFRTVGLGSLIEVTPKSACLKFSMIKCYPSVNIFMMIMLLIP
ncbi:hypothetical protein AVEN_36850-1 [Araneus ventricosus]|uniref:Uncharacterized protein n=1 Tax=Araneus ventricosus TaxID=182803 RepID=A0A4Y2P053_ARAVE|nr:hypothetical protein AVEN_36850-1 [Araneus ventricosus]